MRKPIRLVTLCAEQDESHLVDWDKHLSAIKAAFGIAHFHPRSCIAGEPLARLDEELAKAHLCVCLLSASFLADEKCMVRARQVLNQLGILVLLVRLRAVDLKGSPFGQLAVVPAEPVLASTKKMDDRCMEVVGALRRVLEKHEDQTPVGTSSKGPQNSASFAGPIKSPINRTRLRTAKQALFIILVWEKCKEILSSTIGAISGSLHVTPSITKSLLLGLVVAAVGVSVGISVQQPVHPSASESVGSLATHSRTPTEPMPSSARKAERPKAGGTTLVKAKQSIAFTREQRDTSHENELRAKHLADKIRASMEHKPRKIRAAIQLAEIENQSILYAPDMGLKTQIPVDMASAITPSKISKPQISVLPRQEMDSEDPTGRKISDGESSLLIQAETKLGLREYDAAIKIAKKIIDGSSDRFTQTPAWRVIGEAACGSKNASLATEAYNEVDYSSKQYLEIACRYSGIPLGIASKTAAPW